MTDSIRKIIVIGLMAFIVPFLGPVSAAADAESLPVEKMQPQALNCTGIYQLKQLAPDLTGTGIKFAVICRSISYIDGEPQNDYRPNIKHNCFNAAQFNFNDQAKSLPGISPHSTAICSILFGDDPNAFHEQLQLFSYHGIVPQAKVDIYEFWHFLINNVFPHSPPGADILTVSVGSAFEDWWTRGIEAMAEHYGLVVVAGIGNGSDAYDPPLYPAAGSNVIGVGVVDSVNTENLETALANFALAYPEHSSFGPTADGRCKPDIVAPGNCMAADINDSNTYVQTGNWSSFSTPIVAGTIGLLTQKAKQDQPLSLAVSPDGGNCVIKAILMNSATKLPYWHKGKLTKEDDHAAPLDYVQGAGMLNATGAYEHLVAGRAEPNNVPTIGWDLNQLQKGQISENIYKVTLAESADKLITVTAVWNKHYDRNYPFGQLPDKDADLRLELWAVDTNDPNNSYLLDYSDSKIDNVEHIHCDADANYFNYEIIISHGNVEDPNRISPAQRYALAWNVSEKQDSSSIFWYDLNADGVVNDLDLNIMANNLLTGIKSEDDGYLLGDINTDGIIDVNDFYILFDHKNIQADWLKK